MTSARKHPHPRRPGTGASLVELMVGLVVGLLVSLAAAKSAEVFNAIQRQGVATGAGRANAQSALTAVKDDVAAGGMGFFVDTSFRCTSLNLSVGNSVLSNNAGFSPVQATRVGSDDRLDVVYAHDVTAGAWSALKEVSDGNSATLKTVLPVDPVQRSAVLLARGDNNLASPCLVRSTTASSSTVSTGKQLLTFDITGDHNKAAFAVAPNFRENEPVIMLGSLNWNRYELDGTNLVIDRRMDSTRAVLLNNVIAFRVQYGVTNVSTSVEEWHGPDEGGWNAVTAALMSRVRAVRIGVVIRSAQREKPDPADNQCKASDDAPGKDTRPRLFNGALTIQPPGTDWKCYRYRTAEVVAPIRNLVLGTGTMTWAETQQP